MKEQVFQISELLKEVDLSVSLSGKTDSYIGYDLVLEGRTRSITPKLHS